jgi:hypothetical protein
MDDCDIAIQVPVRFFEHFVILRAWHTLSQEMLKNVVKEELYLYHIDEARYIFPIVDTDPLQRELNKKKKLIEQIVDDSCFELTI